MLSDVETPSIDEKLAELDKHDENDATPDKQNLVEYTCERCGYHYSKVFDYPPYLCYRCMRFISKRTYTIMHTIQPPTSRPERDEI